MIHLGTVFNVVYFR